MSLVRHPDSYTDQRGHATPVADEETLRKSGWTVWNVTTRAPRIQDHAWRPSNFSWSRIRQLGRPNFFYVGGPGRPSEKKFGPLLAKVTSAETGRVSFAIRGKAPCDHRSTTTNLDYEFFWIRVRTRTRIQKNSCPGGGQMGLTPSALPWSASGSLRRNTSNL